MTGDDFDWLSTSALGEAACVTMVKTTDADAVLRGFGGIASEARTIPFAETGNDRDHAYAVAVCRRGEYVVAIEVNGFQGSRPEVLRRVSRLGETVSAFWNIEALTRFSYAVDGRIRTAFEAGADSWKEGEDPDCLAPLVAEIDWEAGHWRTGLLLLAARLTGQPFTEDWLDGEVVVAPIAEHLEDVHPVTPGFEPLEYQHPVLAAALLRAEDEALLAVARAAVDEVVASAGLTAVPEGATEFDELVRMARYGASGRTVRLVALDAVRALRTAPNPLTAAFKTIGAANLAKQLDRLDPAPMLAGFLDLLGNPPAPSGADGARAGTGGPLERHAWITGHWLGLAASITYARGVPLDSVAAAFGGIAFGAGPVSLTDTGQVALRQEGDWTIAIAFNRSPFAHEIVDALRHTTVLNVGWETRGNKLAYYARPGHDVAVMRPGQGDVPAPLVPYTTSLPGPAGNAAAWLLALGEAVTGLAFTPEGLDAHHTLLRPG